jgi:hypothetical protein
MGGGTRNLMLIKPGVSGISLMNPTKYFVALTLVVAAAAVGAVPTESCGTCQTGQSCQPVRGVSMPVVILRIADDAFLTLCHVGEIQVYDARCRNEDIGACKSCPMSCVIPAISQDSCRDDDSEGLILDSVLVTLHGCI